MEKYRNSSLAALALASLPGIAWAAPQAPSGDIAPGAGQTAAADAGTGLEEIVVTAQRRSERLQDVPIAVTAVSEAALTKSGVVTTTQLQAVVPGLNLTTSGGGAVLLPRLRGVGAQTNGPGIENSVATYIDGVYLGAASGSVLTLTGIKNIEVLKGPQGTLFGRNATGGLINIITVDPSTELTANGSVSYGNYQTFTGRAYVSAPITNTIRANLSGQIITQGQGFGRDLLTGQQNGRTIFDLALRSKILAELAPDTLLTVGGDYYRSKSTNAYSPLVQNIVPVVFLSPGYKGGPYDNESDLPNLLYTHGGGASIRLDQGLGSVKLVSISAYRENGYRTFIDFDGSAVPAISVNPIVETAKQFSQEVQLLSNNHGPFKWIAGAYYYWQRAQYNPSTTFFGGPLGFLPSDIDIVGQVTKSIAGFAQADLTFGSTTFTAGIRYTHEIKREFGSVETLFPGGGTSTKDYSSSPGNSITYSKPTFRLAVSRKFTPDVLGYASFSRGFKSGGFNANAPQDAPFKAENLDSYEVGLKSDLIRNILRLNLSAFYYNYTNIQVSRYIAGAAVIINGPKARVYGGEAELVARITPRLTVNGGLSWAHSEFVSFPNADFIVGCPAGAALPCPMSAQGKPLPYAPEVSGNGNIDYEIPLASGGKITANGNVYYNSGYSADVADTFSQGRYVYLNGAIGWQSPNNRINVSVWAHNITNAIVKNAIFYAAGLTTVVQYDPPRTYGATVGFNF